MTKDLTEPLDETQEDQEYTMFSIKDHERCDPITVPVTINGVPVEMELDTGASLSVLCHET